MVLAVGGVKKSQAEIAKAVYKPWWGTNQQIMLAYLSKFFKVVNYKHSATTTDISKHLKKGHIVILDWWDKLDEESPEGHYSLVGDYDSKAKILTLVDPSKTRKGLWHIAAKDFNPMWYDTLDTNNRTWIDGYMLWVDSTSKISS